MKKVMRRIVPVIALFMCLLLAACHNTGLEGDSSIDPANTSTESTKYSIPRSTDPLPKMYTYRIIGGIHPVDIPLPFRIEDYMETGEDGNRVFDLEAVAEDCGWKKTDDYYYYDYGEVWLKFEISFYPQSRYDGAVWISMLQCTYVYPDSPEQVYYDFEGTSFSDTDGFEMILAFDDNCEICETKDGSFLYFRDAVIVACIFSTAMVKPGDNPTTTYGLSAYGNWPSNESDKIDKTNKFYIGPEIPKY